MKLLVVYGFLAAAVAVIVGVVWLGRHFATRRSPEIDAVVAELTERGLPVTMKEYWEQLPEVGNDENAALVYQLAIGTAAPVYEDSLALPLVGTDKRDLPLPNEPAPPEVVKALADFFDGHKEFLGFLHKGAGLPASRYDVQWAGFVTLLQHLTPIRQSTRHLALAAWLDAANGDSDAAVERARDALALAGSLSDEPCVISQLVRFACCRITVETSLAQVLSRADPSQEALEALQKDIEKAAEGISLTGAYEGEYLRLLHLYETTYAGDSCELEALMSIPQSPFEDERPVWRAKLSLGKDVAFVMRNLVRMRDMAENLTPEVLQKAAESKLSQEFAPSGCPMFKMWEESFDNLVYQVGRTVATLRSAAAVSAACRFRNDHGRWPEALDEMVPGYVDAVPLDPFRGAPLVYRRMSDGIIVYAPGKNGIEAWGEGEPPEDFLTDDDYSYGGLRIWKAPVAPEGD